MRRMATTWPSAAGRGRGQILGQFALHLAIDGRQQRGLGPIGEEVYEHQDHRERKGHRRRVELQAQARHHLHHRRVERLGIDAVQGQRDADDRAQKAEDGDRPHDQAKQTVAAVGPRGIPIGKVFQFIAEAFRRTETQDVLHRRAEPAQVIFVLPMRRLAIQLRMQRPAKFIRRQLAAVDGFPGRFAQGPSLGDDVGKPQHERRHANREQQRFAIFDRVVREVAMHHRQVQRTTENQPIKGRTGQNAPDDRRPHDRTGKMVQGIHSRFPWSARKAWQFR